jgi:competence protein ComEA
MCSRDRLARPQVMRRVLQARRDPSTIAAMSPSAHPQHHRDRDDRDTHDPLWPAPPGPPQQRDRDRGDERLPGDVPGDLPGGLGAGRGQPRSWDCDGDGSASGGLTARDRSSGGPANSSAWSSDQGWTSGPRVPLRLRLVRVWLEPRPGELRAAVVLLALALAVTLALWFDAARRPVPSGAVGGFTPVRVEGVDLGGWSGPDVSVAGGAAGAVNGQQTVDAWASSGPRAVTEVVVHVSGSVLEPGLVNLPVGSRVGDALLAAGGALPDARLDRLNLARPLVDGEQVHVPRVGEDAPLPVGPTSRGVLPDGRIELNRATAAELETLPGIGPARAQAIIAAREERPFRVPGDLRRVPGIGEATFQRLAPLVAVT